MCGFQVSGVESGAGFGWLYSLGCQVEVADSGCRSGVGCRARVGCRFRMVGCRDPQELPPMYVIVIANGLQEPLLLMYLYIYIYICTGITLLTTAAVVDQEYCCCCCCSCSCWSYYCYIHLIILLPRRFSLFCCIYIYITIQKPEPLSPSIYKNLQTPSSPHLPPNKPRNPDPKTQTLRNRRLMRLRNRARLPGPRQLQQLALAGSSFTALGVHVLLLDCDDENCEHVLSDLRHMPATCVGRRPRLRASRSRKHLF